MKNKQLNINTITSILFPRLEDVVFISIFMGVVVMGPRLFNVDGDLGRHLTVGQYILQNLRIPTHDIFSHTMFGLQFTPHEWIAEILFAASNMMLGLNGVVVLSALVIATTFMLVYRDTLRRCSMLIVSMGLTFLAAITSNLHWLARPHLFTFLFIALWTERMERVSRGDHKLLWQFPLIMLLWVNIHGAFIAGFVIWGAYLVGWLWDHRLKTSETNSIKWNLLLAGGLSFLTTFLNPSGWRLWSTSLGYIQNRYLTSHTVEYQPPDFQQIGTWPFLVLLALTIFILSRSQRRLATQHTLLLSGWVVMSLYSARNIPLYAIVAAPILAEVISIDLSNKYWQRIENNVREIDKMLRGHIWLVATVILIPCILMSGIPLDNQRRGNQFDPVVFPIQAVDWLESHPQEGNMFNYFIWGGYLLYREWPEMHVFIDGQTDFYGEALTRQYKEVINLGEGWENILNTYQVEWIIIPTKSALSKVLIKDLQLPVLYSDETTIIVRWKTTQ